MSPIKSKIYLHKKVWYLNLGLDARKPVVWVCKQQMRNAAEQPAQTDQRLCYSLFGKHHYLNLLHVKLVSVAEETDFSLTLSETPKIGFATLRPILYAVCSS